MSHITVHKSVMVDGLTRVILERQKRIADRREKILVKHRGKKTGWPFINRRLMTDGEIIDSFDIWDDYWMVAMTGSATHDRIVDIAKMCMLADLITLSRDDVRLLDNYDVFMKGISS